MTSLTIFTTAQYIEPDLVSRGASTASGCGNAGGGRGGRGEAAPDDPDATPGAAPAGGARGSLDAGPNRSLGTGCAIIR